MKLFKGEGHPYPVPVVVPVVPGMAAAVVRQTVLVLARQVPYLSSP